MTFLKNGTLELPQPNSLLYQLAQAEFERLNLKIDFDLFLIGFQAGFTAEDSFVTATETDIAEARLILLEKVYYAPIETAYPQLAVNALGNCKSIEACRKLTLPHSSNCDGSDF